MDFGFGDLIVIGALSVYILWKLCNTATTFLTLLVLTGTAIYFYMRHKRGYWERRGVKCPPGSLLFGHMGELGKGVGKADQEWTKTYGRVFGTYMFWKPDLVVSDLTILRRILAKDFSSFPDRKQSFGNRGQGTTLMSQAIFLLKGQHWREVRNTVTPAFTTGKIKNVGASNGIIKMVPLFNGCLKILGTIVTEKADNDEELDLKRISQGFSTDIISKSVFAMDVNAQYENDNPFIKYANELFTMSLASPSVLLMFLFPFFVRVLEKSFGLVFFFKEGDRFFKSVLKQMFAQREQTPKPESPDFMQLLINTMNSSTAQKPAHIDENDAEIMHDVVKNAKTVQLTELEAMAQCFLFLVAGIETTATTIHWVLYLLAIHPEIQERCYTEVSNIMGSEEDITYQHVRRLTYVEQVICETLRMFPPAQRTDRECTKDTVIDEHLTIPAGCSITVPIYTIHHDPEYYQEPEKFDPERFSAEERTSRDPLSYLPFGYGPHNCIGMRFAQLELRMAIAYLVLKFKFLPTDKTEKLPIELSAQNMSKPKRPISLRVERRH